MYELFYNFLIDELLVKYFKQIDIEAGDKFYVVIEDSGLRQDFYKALSASAYTEKEVLVFPGFEKYEVSSLPYETVKLICSNSGTPILVSGCDDADDGFQTMIRNSVGVMGNPVSEMAALFILPGTNAIETLLSAGRNLQERPNPFSVDSITHAIYSKIDKRINEIEKQYIRYYIEKLRFQDDYISLFDFAPVLSILQSSNLMGNFYQIEAFEDKEIYDNLFAASTINIKERVKENNHHFAVISEMMGEAYEQDQYKKLSTYLDSKLASKIVSNKVDWKRLDFSEIHKSHQTYIENAVLKKPVIKLVGDAELVCNPTGSDKKSNTYVLVCDPNNTATHLKAAFNKDLKDYQHGDDAKVSGTNLVFTLVDNVLKDKIGDEKNNHSITILHLPTKNVFNSISHYFKIDLKKNIVVEVPDSMDSVTLGIGTNQISYDGFNPVELDDNSVFSINFDFNSSEEPMIPFKFGNTTLNIRFRFKGEKTPTLPPSTIIGNIWGIEDGGYIHDGEAGDIAGTISGKQGPVYIYDRLRKLVNLEKKMIDNKVNHLNIEKNEFSEEEETKNCNVAIDSSIQVALNGIFDYFHDHNTVPSFIRPDDELKSLYNTYLSAVHSAISQIPTDQSLSKNLSAMNIAKLGVVENEDGTILLSPFHPLMVAYSLQMSETVDVAEFNKKVIDELSSIYLMPFIYYGKHILKAVASPETEDILTWVKYDIANNAHELEASKSTSTLITDKIEKFIENFKYYFPDTDCPIRIGTVGLSQSVDVVRGVVLFINKNRKLGNVQKIEIHEYVDDVLVDTFFEKLNRQSSRDNISDFFGCFNFGIDDADLNEIIRLLSSRVSYYKHSFKTNRKMQEFCHVTFYKIDSGTRYTAHPSINLRTETSLEGLVSIPSTNLTETGEYLMGYGTKGNKPNSSPVYQMCQDMNSLYASLENGGLVGYRPNQCLAKIYSFDDRDFLETVYQNSTWVTFINPEVDIDFFYKQNLYVVHYVEQHSITARLESITVTRHIGQYNKMLFNSLQSFKAIIGTSEDFSRKMISYFNCLNGKWLLQMIKLPILKARERMSDVATCFVMQHFLKRVDGVIWIPIALDEIVKVTGSIGMPLDGLFSKKDLGIKGALSDDILMMGIRKNSTGEVETYFYPVEVKVLSDDAVDHGETQVAKLYNEALKNSLFTGKTFTRQAYRAMFASQLLSNIEKMRANNLISLDDYALVDSCRYDLLNVKFNINEDLPAEIGKAGLVVYSNATAKSLSTEWVDDVPVCHIRMMESDCYRIVANPDTNLLQFVENSAIAVSTKPETVTTSVPEFRLDEMFEPTTDSILDSDVETAEDVIPDDNENSEENSASINSGHVMPSAPVLFSESDTDELNMVANPEYERMLIKVGESTKNGHAIIIEPNNPKVVTHPNIGITGTMGTGKTQLLRSIIAQFAKSNEGNVGGKPIGLLVFDYKGDYNDDGFLEKVGGTCTFCNIPFNPLKLIKTKRNVMQNLPAITAEAISDSLVKSFESAGPVQRAKITQVIIDTYNEFGITADSATWDKPAPTINDIIDRYLENNNATDTVYSYFNSIKNFGVFSSRPEDCVSIFEWLDRVRVIDLTEINSEAVKSVVVSLILDVLNKEMLLLGSSEISEDGRRQLRAMIVADEAHQFMQKDFNAVEQIFRQGRAFGVGMILATQNMSDFKTKNNDYTSYMASWLLHHQTPISKQELVGVFGATDKRIQNYMDYLNNAQQFESIAKIGVDKISAMKDYPYFKLIHEDKRFITKYKVE